MKYGSIVMMKIPKPKPVVRCTKLAPMLNMNMAIRMLLIFRLFLHDRHVGSLPRDDATFQIHALIADISKSSCSIGRTATTTTINSNGLVCRQCRLCLLHEITLPLVYQDSPLNMSFCKFSSRPYIKHYHITVCNQFCELLHISILKILLATSRC